MARSRFCAKAEDERAWTFLVAPAYVCPIPSFLEPTTSHRSICYNELIHSSGDAHMDPITAGILSGLIANALTGMEKPVARWARTGSSPMQEQLRREFDKASSGYRLRIISNLPSMKLTAREEARFISFLNSAEARAAARSIVISMTADREDIESAELRNHLSALIALSSGLPAKSASKLAGFYYNSVSTVCQTALEMLKDKSPQEYARAQKAANLERLAGYLKNISHRTKIFRRLHPSDVTEAHQFIQDYLALAHSRASEVAPAHLSEQRTVGLERIYVPPTLRRTNQTSDQPVVSLEGFMDAVYRDVVLGDPGAGKSTLTQKIVLDMTLETANAATIPFVVSVRNLQAYQQGNRSSIARYIEALMNEEYQLEPPPGIVDYLLASGRALIIFDGLDELIDTYKKRQMKKTIENFAQLYAPSPILVTSRKVGYSEAPLSITVFRASVLEPFTNKQSAQYVVQWYGIDTSLSKQQRHDIASAFLRESSRIEDLRSNPLMLSLLCNVYRSLRSIPQSRAELYQQCALMLFERWDSQRGIMAPGVLRGDARRALQAIALWIFENPSTGRQIPHRQLSRRLQKILLSRYEDERRAQEVAEDLLELWRGRAWVLTDCGTSPRGEVVYGFTHQTFLEYFAGVELSYRNHSPEELWGALAQHVAMEEWDIVAQIAIQTLDNASDRGTDSIYGLLIGDAKKSRIRDHLNLLNFATRHIEALGPGPAACRNLARACIDLAMIEQPVLAQMPAFGDYIDALFSSVSERRDAGDYKAEDSARFGGQMEPEELLSPLLQLCKVGDDLGQYCHNEFRRYLRRLISSEDETIATKAFVLGVNENLILGTLEEENDSAPDGGHVTSESDIFSRPEVEQLVSRYGRLNFWLPVEGIRQGFLDIAETIRSFGLDFLLCSRASLFHPAWTDRRTRPLAAELIAQVVEAETASSLGGGVGNVLREAAAAFRYRFSSKHPRPFDPEWFEDSGLESFVFGVDDLGEDSAQVS